MEITISACTKKRQLKTFERVPEILHKQDRSFVPPFPGSVSKIFKENSPFLKRHGEIYPFIAYRNGSPVGRIAAILNHTHNHYHQDRVGFFGFFDADGPNTAQILWASVEKFLKEKGFVSARGPVNPSINDELGLLVDGFDRPPFVLMPYNPPYYETFYRELGLEKARDLFAYYISASVTSPERIEKIASRVQKATGLTLRSVNLAHLREELKSIGEIYNSTLNRNWGFIPITEEELAAVAQDLRPILDPEMVLIAEKEGRAVGFSIAIPNINEFLWMTRGSGSWLRILKFLWHLKTKRPKEARLLLLGIIPEFRNKGIASLFYFETLKRGKGKFIGGELSWIDEDNEEIIRAIELMGGKCYKTYRIFEKKLV